MDQIHTQKHLRVLHIDDCEDDRIITHHHLSRLGRSIEIVWADTVDEARNHLREGQFDCILCDYQMPREDGLSFLKTLRESRVDIPFIMLTGNGSEQIASRAMELGADDYFSKMGGTQAYKRVLNSMNTLVEAYNTRKTTERLVAEYRQLFDDNVSGVFEIDTDGSMLRVNASFTSLLGFEDGSIPGQFRFSSLFEQPADWQSFIGDIKVKGHAEKKLVTLIDRRLQARNVILQASKSAGGDTIIGSVRPARAKHIKDGNGTQHRFSLEHYINFTVAPLCYFVLEKPIPIESDIDVRLESIQHAVLAECNDSFSNLMGISPRASMIGEQFETLFNHSNYAGLRSQAEQFAGSMDTFYQPGKPECGPGFTVLYSVHRHGVIAGFWGSLGCLKDVE